MFLPYMIPVEYPRKILSACAVPVGKCSLRAGTRAILIKKRHLLKIFYYGKIWELRRAKISTILKKWVGLVEIGAGGLVVGEATVDECLPLTEEIFRRNGHLHLHSGRHDDYNVVWVLKDVVRYDKRWVYDHLQGSQTPSFLYNLHDQS